MPNDFKVANKRYRSGRRRRLGIARGNNKPFILLQACDQVIVGQDFRVPWLTYVFLFIIRPMALLAAVARAYVPHWTPLRRLPVWCRPFITSIHHHNVDGFSLQRDEDVRLLQKGSLL